MIAVQQYEDLKSAEEAVKTALLVVRDAQVKCYGAPLETEVHMLMLKAEKRLSEAHVKIRKMQSQMDGAAQE